jgi:D-arabinose 1-dehydrogenase-like Zn-dependent alcohol dehydrogenase
VRAIVVRAAGADFRVEELRTPTPGPGEVLLRVAACGVCHTDLHVQDGSLGFRFPATLGHEVSGTVEEVVCRRGVQAVADSTAQCAEHLAPGARSGDGPDQRRGLV